MRKEKENDDGIEPQDPVTLYSTRNPRRRN